MKFASLAVGVALGVAIFLGVQWYLYVTSANNPHDDLGTELNAMMPGALNAWGCEMLRARFPDAVAPKGCLAQDGQTWRK
ncbi:MAG: hypothetical protein H7Y08_04025 [Rhizobiaceae bacterium]|nr:hypothetical protein [Rhizobiaceae bacterium]